MNHGVALCCAKGCRPKFVLLFDCVGITSLMEVLVVRLALRWVCEAVMEPPAPCMAGHS
jgi:hypothetical protein